MRRFEMHRKGDRMYLRVSKHKVLWMHINLYIVLYLIACALFGVLVLFGIYACTAVAAVLFK